MMDLLIGIARDVIERGLSIEDATTRLERRKVDLSAVRRELRRLEEMRVLEDEEADAIKVVLAHLILRSIDLEPDDIYAHLFCDGRMILWN